MEDYDNYSKYNSNIMMKIINLHMKKNVIIEENEDDIINYQSKNSQTNEK
jgi:hypothetical protein